MSSRARELPHRTTTELLAGLEGERVVSLAEAGRLNDLSIDTLRRRHANLDCAHERGTARHATERRAQHRAAARRRLSPAERPATRRPPIPFKP